MGSKQFVIKSSLKKIFGVGVLAYTLIRFMLVYATFVDRGLNPWVFLVVDLVSAIPYIVGFPKLIESIVNKRKSKIAFWAFVFSIGLLTPTVFIAISVDQMPALLWLILSLYLFIIVLLAALRLRRQIRERGTN